MHASDYWGFGGLAGVQKQYTWSIDEAHNMLA
jgi:hypothetical protein